MRILGLLLLAAALGGCVRTAVDTAWDAATLPVHVVGRGVDLMTTSQAEADRNYGRKMRKESERDRKEQRRAAKEQRREQREARDAARQGG